MKTATYTITKDIQTVWMLSNGDTIIGTNQDTYFVRTSDLQAWPRSFLLSLFGNPLSTFHIFEYTKDEMIEIYNLNENHFANIKHSGI